MPFSDISRTTVWPMGVARPRDSSLFRALSGKSFPSPQVVESLVERCIELVEM
jgi:hypothetical protein